MNDDKFTDADWQKVSPSQQRRDQERAKEAKRKELLASLKKGK